MVHVQTGVQGKRTIFQPAHPEQLHSEVSGNKRHGGRGALCWEGWLGERTRSDPITLKGLHDQHISNRSTSKQSDFMNSFQKGHLALLLFWLHSIRIELKDFEEHIYWLFFWPIFKCLQMNSSPHLCWWSTWYTSIQSFITSCSCGSRPMPPSAWPHGNYIVGLTVHAFTKYLHNNVFDQGLFIGFKDTYDTMIRTIQYCIPNDTTESHP